MKKLTIALAIIMLTWGMACADSLSGRYVSRPTENGWLFHTLSRDMPKAADKKASKDATYDYTYIESADSVTMLMTLTLKEITLPSGVSLTSCGKTYSQKPEIIYVEKKGDNSIYRLGIKMPYSFWRGLYECASPFMLECNFSKRAQPYCWSIGTGKWEKERETMLQLCNLIELNTGKHAGNDEEAR